MSQYMGWNSLPEFALTIGETCMKILDWNPDS